MNAPTQEASDITSRKVHVTEFKRIHTDAPFRVVAVAGEQCGVTITGPADAVAAVQIRCAVRTLNIKQGPGDHDSSAITIHVTAPRLERVCVAGAGEVELQLRKHTSLDLVVDTEATGNIVVTSGEVMFLDAQLRGSGSIRAKPLLAIEGRLVNKGAGRLDASVTYSLTAKLLGAGDINVWGNPRARDLDPRGAGCISLL